MKLRGNHIAGLVIVIVGVLLVFVFVQGQHAESPPGAPIDARVDPAAGTGTGERFPIAEVDSTDIDFGEIPKSPPTVKEVMVRNVGTANMVIRNVTTTCPCTQGHFRNDVIPPGGEEPLIITEDPTRYGGWEWTQVLTVISNAGPLRLNVSARIAPDYEIVPAEVDFGAAPRGERLTETIVWRRLADEPVQFLEAEVVPGVSNLRALAKPRPQEQWQNPDKEEFDITIELYTGAEPGPYLGGLNVRVTGSHVTSYPVTVRAEIE